MVDMVYFYGGLVLGFALGVVVISFINGCIRDDRP